MNLKAAREKRDQLKALIKEGKDPKKIQDQEKKEKAELLRRKQIEEEGVFKRVAKDWLNRQSAFWTVKHTQRTLRCLEKHVFPELRGMHLTEIDVRKVLGLLRVLEDQGKSEAAHRVRLTIDAMFR